MAQYWPPNGYSQPHQTWPPPNQQQSPPTWPPPNPSAPGQYPPATQPSFGYASGPPANYLQGTYPPQPQPPAPAQQYYQYQTAAPLPPNSQYGLGNQQPAQQPAQPPAGSYPPSFAPPPQHPPPPPPPPPSAFPPPQPAPTYFSQQALYNQPPPQTAPAQPVNNGQYPPTNTPTWNQPTPVVQPPQPTQTLPSSYPFPNLNNSGSQNSYGGYAQMSPVPTATANAGVQATAPSYTSTNSGRSRVNNGTASHGADRKRKTSSTAAVRNSTHWQCCDCNFSTVNGYRNEITGKYEHCRFDNGFTTHKRCRRCRDEFGVSFSGE